MTRRVLVVLLLCAGAGLASAAAAQSRDVVEVVQVRGIIDGPVEGAITRTIATARRDGAEVVILQVDSDGNIDAGRLARLSRAVRASEVPVVAWVGPPGARARHGAAALVAAADVQAMAPGTALGPAATADLRSRTAPPVASLDRALSADEAEGSGRIDFIALSLPEVLRELGDVRGIDLEPEDVTARFRKPDLFGRLLHAVAQPSIVYLLLLLGLVGVVFELFHPMTGPAGLTGAAALVLSAYGMSTLRGSWVAVAIVVAAVTCFSVDLRVAGLGLFTLLGTAGLVAGSLLLFRGPYLRVNAWVLAIGIVGMLLFMLGAMTRVLRDLRAIARGELEVRDAHAHLEEDADDA